MISELPFSSSQPELGKILEGIVRAGEKVIEVYETDFSSEKKEDDSQLKIGICYIKLNDNVRAKKELQNYVDQYPQGEFVSKARSYLGQLD